jgi:hypothetical protein
MGYYIRERDSAYGIEGNKDECRMTKFQRTIKAAMSAKMSILFRLSHSFVIHHSRIAIFCHRRLDQAAGALLIDDCN